MIHVRRWTSSSKDPAIAVMSIHYACRRNGRVYTVYRTETGENLCEGSNPRQAWERAKEILKPKVMKGGTFLVIATRPGIFNGNKYVCHFKIKADSLVEAKSLAGSLAPRGSRISIKRWSEATKDEREKAK